MCKFLNYSQNQNKYFIFNFNLKYYFGLSHYFKFYYLLVNLSFFFFASFINQINIFTLISQSIEQFNKHIISIKNID